MSHTEGARAEWSDFWVALLLWGPDVQGQLLKAAGFTFRAAAAVPTALIHFMISVEGYSALQHQVTSHGCPPVLLCAPFSTPDPGCKAPLFIHSSTVRHAARLPMPLHVWNGVTGGCVPARQHDDALLTTDKYAPQVQEMYPAQMAACVTAVRDSVQLLLPKPAAVAVQPFITARTFCYWVRPFKLFMLCMGLSSCSRCAWAPVCREMV